MEKTFKSFVESVLDPVRDYYNKLIFDDWSTENPKIKSSVKKQVLGGIEILNKIHPVVDYEMIGSILTKQYTPTSDLDINVIFDLDPNDPKLAEIRKFLGKELNGRLVRGTTHPINYAAVTREQGKYAIERADAAFNIKTNQWIRQPLSSRKQVDIDFYTNKFAATFTTFDLMKNKFARDLVDYREYKVFETDPVAAKQFHDALDKKLKVLEDDINQLIDNEEDVHNKRRAVFARELTPDEFQLYGTHNRLPQNILYKLLERYHYTAFIKHLKKVIGDDRVLTHDEADQL